jgi:aminopeptidase N
MTTADASTSASASATQPRESARLLLPAVPTHYDLSYERIDMKDPFDFVGRVDIHMQGQPQELLTTAAEASSSSITLHCHQVQIIEAALHFEGVILPAQALHYHMRNQTCTILFDSNNAIWKPDTVYILKIAFHGVVNDLLCGLYRSTYVDPTEGTTQTIITTQFEPCDARRAFPCFDEPALKATFTLSVRVPVDLQVISNTPPVKILTEDNTTGFQRVTFGTTPKMSTYLLALVIGQFDSISTTQNDILTTVYTVPGKALQGQFCLETASRCLEFYQDLFGIAYPLTKSDLLALPDFAAGAMVRTNVMSAYIDAINHAFTKPRFLLLCVVAPYLILLPLLARKIGGKHSFRSRLE